MAERTLSDIYELIVGIEKKMEGYAHFFPIVERLDKNVHGNGEGLVTKMALVNEREAKRDRREWFIYALLTAEIVGLLFTIAAS